ncbi:bifunctional lysylphosphatidylglycerol synthetase/lysine--tRNA ligase LysX [Kocuria tytonicola]|uniref:Lysine--tRNA ligase n=1 Tax=Kocuria tytonicola TaxID=2055946 RepID=A0A3L9LBA4_9MICC|nr:bifunctional lysylphosphatidylglycerol synthetase/lysine--tRNA ligase LysX [Kocuria tytonicola]RLY93722.1 bifunctional lysylphosphatidylglycerol synthetase/lysine--tRNA ligase LysX [Kocuria tytonicola]
MKTSHDRLPRLASTLVFLAALWSFISIPFAQKESLYWVDEVFTTLGVPSGPNLFLALSLLIVGASLRRRLRVAWVVSLGVLFLELLVFVLLGVALLTDSVEGELEPLESILLVVGAVVTTAWTVAFIVRRKDFPARMRSGALRNALLTLLGGLLLVMALVFAVSWFVPGHLHGVEHLWFSVRSVTGLSLPRSISDGSAGPHWLAVLAGVLGAAVLFYAVWQFTQSAQRSEVIDPRQELHIRRLLAQYGAQDSLGYFATRRDKSVIFSPDGRAAVSYRVIGSVCLASGDPLGPHDAWQDAIAAWKQEGREHAWRLAVLSASETGAQAYVDAGLRARPLGDEAVLETDSFSLEGRTMRPVKRAVARVRDAGCTVTLERHSQLDAATLQQIIELSEKWRGDEADRGFSMALNRLADRTDGRCVAVLVRNAQGEIVALQSYVPWGTRGISLDLMRRSPDAPNGVNEAMVAALAEDGGELGIREVSLNFAMFRSVFTGADKVGAGLGVRIADRVLSWGNRFWQLESLYEANAKYLPRWDSRFLCYDSTADLPLVGIAAGRAEGFLPGRSPRPGHDGETLVTAPDGTTTPLADLVIAQDRELLTPPRPVRQLSEQQRVRHAKLDVLREAGMEPYPVDVPHTTTVEQALELIADGTAETTGEVVSIGGRVRALRDLGGVVFAVVEERDVRIQVVLEERAVAPELMRLWRRAVDVGDHVSVTGTLGRSRRGEPSVLATSWCMASKSLRPVPSEHTGFTNPEARVRQRYLDLIVNKESAQLLRARSRGIAAMRQSFMERGFMEVETPMLQAVHGGASARPFRTHINAYNADLYLRIAPELYLKHLCVGGMDKIFELNRNFRNEGADATHNPEFTSVEAYAAHGDYNTMRVLTRELILEVATAIHGEPVAVRPDGEGGETRIRLDHEWPVIPVHQAVSEATGTLLTSTTPLEEVRAVADAHNVHWHETMTAGEVVLELYDELVEGQTTLPVFYTDFPLETSPLTRTHRTDPRLSERWDLVAFGAEIGTAYSELVDPVDQRNRLTEQSFKAAAGDPEAMEVDENFLTALEYAMPPTGGLGIGVDRLIMMLTGTNIRATLAFPFTRPNEQG